MRKRAKTHTHTHTHTTRRPQKTKRNESWRKKKLRNPSLRDGLFVKQMRQHTTRVLDSLTAVLFWLLDALTANLFGSWNADKTAAIMHRPSWGSHYVDHLCELEINKTSPHMHFEFWTHPLQIALGTGKLKKTEANMHGPTVWVHSLQILFES